MLDYSPHIFISPTIRLDLPIDFQPNDILVKASPKNRAFVLTAGCEALDILLKTSDSLSYEEAYEKATTEQTAKWQIKKSLMENEKEQEKANILAENSAAVQNLKTELDSQQKNILRKDEAIKSAESRARIAEENENLVRKSISENNTHIRNEVEAETKRERDKLSNDLTEAKAAAEKAAAEHSKALNKLVADIKEVRKEVEKEKLEDIQMLQKKLEDAIKEKDKTSKDLNDYKLEVVEKEKQEALQAKEDENAAVQKIRDEHKSEVESHTNQRVRSATSSLKGKDNETVLEKLVYTAFSDSGDFKVLPKTNEAGDLIIMWEEMKLMFEFKHVNLVQSSDVAKAQRDLETWTDCDALIFISSDSSIANRKRYFDISTMQDGRPIVWIGEFNVNDDKVVYLQMVGQVAKNLVRLQKTIRGNRGKDNRVDGFEQKIGILHRSFRNTNDDLKKMMKARNTYARLQKEAWDTFNFEINEVIKNFGHRLNDALKDNDQAESEMMEIEASSKTPKKAGRSLIKQKKNKKNSNQQRNRTTTKNNFEPESKKSRKSLPSKKSKNQNLIPKTNSNVTPDMNMLINYFKNQENNTYPLE